MKKPRIKLSEEQKQKLQVFGLAIFSMVFMTLLILLLIFIDQNANTSLSSQLML